MGLMLQFVALPSPLRNNLSQTLQKVKNASAPSRRRTSSSSPCRAWSIMYLARVARTRSLCSSESRPPLALMDCHALSNAAIKMLTAPGSKTWSSARKSRTDAFPPGLYCSYFFNWRDDLPIATSGFRPDSGVLRRAYAAHLRARARAEITSRTPCPSDGA